MDDDRGVGGAGGEQMTSGAEFDTTPAPENPQEAYHAQRRAWNADPENQLIPWPKRRVTRRPEPGVIDADADEDG